MTNRLKAYGFPTMIAPLGGNRLRRVPSCIAAGLLVAMVGLSQAYSPLFALSSGTPMVLYCVDLYGRVQPNCAVSVTAAYYPNTNAHTHNSPGAPLSTATPSSGYTGSDGGLHFILATTIVGHAEYLEGCTYYACDVYQYAVGGAGIYWVSDHGIWIQNGAKAIHGNSVSYNHWMTSNAAYGIYNTTVAYQGQYPGLVYSNDMSLPYGGRFDLNANWVEPHTSSHDLGLSADIDNIPQGNVNTFFMWCQRKGAVDWRQEPNGSPHCRWPY
jgi:hypothetical protein